MNSHWGFNSNQEFGSSARHAVGERDIGICRPDTNSPGNCCGCVRKGDYPCEYQTIGGSPPASIDKCFRDPADWDDDGSTCLSEESAGCCPLPDFTTDTATSETKSKWSPATSKYIPVNEREEKENYWKDSDKENKKGTCYPSVEGGMCKYEDERGLSLFYNYVDGNYTEGGETKNTIDEREEGRNVYRLVNYPKLVAEKKGRDPPETINLCNRDNWNKANILFHQMTTEEGRKYYIDDSTERRRRQRVDSIGRISQSYDSDIGGYRTGNRMMTAEDLLGDNTRGRFGRGDGSLFGDIEPRWNEDQPKDGSLDFESDRQSSLEEVSDGGVLYGFIVPDNTLPGDRIKVRIPSGKLVQFTIPENAVAGQNIKFRVNE